MLSFHSNKLQIYHGAAKQKQEQDRDNVNLKLLKTSLHYWPQQQLTKLLPTFFVHYRTRQSHTCTCNDTYIHTHNSWASTHSLLCTQCNYLQSTIKLSFQFQNLIVHSCIVQCRLSHESTICPMYIYTLHTQEPYHVLYVQFSCTAISVHLFLCIIYKQHWYIDQKHMFQPVSLPLSVGVKQHEQSILIPRSMCTPQCPN